MNDDIVTRLRLRLMGDGFANPEETSEAADEIERLRTLLNNTLERENQNNARQLELVRKVEANRDMWRKTCSKLVGMMLPYSLLMTPIEQEELKIILSEA